MEGDAVPARLMHTLGAKGVRELPRQGDATTLPRRAKAGRISQTEETAKAEGTPDVIHHKQHHKRIHPLMPFRLGHFHAEGGQLHVHWSVCRIAGIPFFD